MQVFGKLWSVPPWFPRGSLLTDQHKSSPSDSSAGHSSAGFSWRGLLSPVVCISRGLEDRLWNLQDCHFSSLLSWYSSSNKHFFFSLSLQLINSTAILGLVLHKGMRKTVCTCKYVLRGRKRDDFWWMLSDKKSFLNAEENHYMFYYIFHKMRTVAVSSGIGWSSDPSNINLHPAAQSIKHHHTHKHFFSFQCLNKSNLGLCVWEGKFYYLCYSSSVSVSLWLDDTVASVFIYSKKRGESDHQSAHILLSRTANEV